MAIQTLQNKVALITGANSGLGKATAIGLAKQGATVVMLSRDQGRGTGAQHEIVEASGNTHVDLLLCDLSSQADIRRVVEVIKVKYPALNLLINNAGNSYMTRQVSVDGIELSLAVNHLASFLLTQLLLETIKANAPARIVNVGTRIDTAMDFDDLQWERRPFQGFAAYSESKLGALHFTFELARRLQGTGVTANCVHPGVFRSNLGKNAGGQPFWLEAFTTLSRPFLMPAEKAAERVLYLATSPAVEGVSGRYYGKQVELKPPAQTLDAAANQRLWEISASLTGLTS